MEPTSCAQKINTTTKYLAIATTTAMCGSVIAMVASSRNSCNFFGLPSDGSMVAFGLSGSASLITLTSWHLTRSLVKTPNAKETSKRQRFFQFLGASMCGLWLAGSAYALFRARGWEEQAVVAVMSGLFVPVPVGGLSIWHAARN